MLKKNVKLFADDTSLFLEICDSLEAESTLDDDLRKICKQAKQSKKIFNRDPAKRDQELIFFRKSYSPKH